MTAFTSPWSLGTKEPIALQGWHPVDTDLLAGGFAAAGGLGVLRVPAFPDESEMRIRLKEIRRNLGGWVGFDLRGVLGDLRAALETAKQDGTAFLAHGIKPKMEAFRAMRETGLPRLVFVRDAAEAAQAAETGANALALEEGTRLQERLAAILTIVKLPVLAPAGSDAREAQELLDGGASGLHVRAPSVLRGEGSDLLRGFSNSLRQTLGAAAFGLLIESTTPQLPTLKIRNMEITYPIFQGGMGVGVSWDRLAGSVARSGCVGLVSALGTGYRDRDMEREGRPTNPTELNSTETLGKILRNAQTIAEGRGAVGVNILCAINEYERVVRDSVAAGARLVVSGAGLPLNLPEYVADADVALVPIVSSGRALKLICKTWERRYKRLPDAVVLEGPESGGHQGFGFEQCLDPAFSLEALLPEVLEERNHWGDFPVIAAGGVWDRADIDRMLALGASGVQMGTRFIGTFECDAADNFKEVILRSRKEDIRLLKSPVGMPARGVLTELQRRIEKGGAPPIRCASNCVTPCEHGKGAHIAGYCIADRLEDAREGRLETGLFFTGSNGWRLRELLSVRDLVGEITMDYGLQSGMYR